MPLEHSFDSLGSGRHTRRDALEASLARVPGGALRAGADSGPGRDAIALTGVFERLVPYGVRRGQALAVREVGGGIGYLSLAIVATALAQGLWCAAVGVAGLGGLALAGLLRAYGAGPGALQRLLVVDDPGERWAEVCAVLADGVDMVLLLPPAAASTTQIRRLSARLRQGAQVAGAHRAALVVLGAWPGAYAQITVERTGWTGFREGVGHLRAGHAVITAEDQARRSRTAELWLPAEGGGVAAVSPGSLGREAGGWAETGAA